MTILAEIQTMLYGEKVKRMQRECSREMNETDFCSYGKKEGR